MQKNNTIDVNTLWFFVVLFHLLGSIVVTIMEFFPLSNEICMLILWFSIFFFCDRTKKNIMIIFAGCIIFLFILTKLSVDLKGSLLMSLAMVIIVLFLAYQKKINILQYCKIKWIPVTQWLPILFIAALFIIIAGYVNAISMFFFHNQVGDSLQSAMNYFPYNLMVFAIVPAISEELVFRGCIYQGIEGSGEKKAVLVSAFLFAILHMNCNQISYAFILGILFAIVVSITDNLSISIMIHMLFNCFNVIVFGITDSSLMYKILSINVKGYYIFNPILKNENGEVLWNNMMIGGILVIAALLTIIALLRLLKKENKETYGKKESGKNVNVNKMEKKNEEKLSEVNQWKPDVKFYFSVFLCLLITFLFELSTFYIG